MVQQKLYAYLNINNPMVAWEVAIGRIESICNDGNQFGVSLWHYNTLKRFLSGDRIVESRNEFELELTRLKYYSDKVSRLRGVYFFESKEMAECALDRWNLSRHKKYITEVDFYSDSSTMVDSEWITSYLNQEEPFDENWMQKYWSGEPMGVRPLTEVLASGFGLVHDKAIRSEAVRRVYDMWPTSSILLNASIAGFAICGLREISRVKPFVTLNDEKIHGNFIIDLDILKGEQKIVAEAMSTMFSQGCDLINIIPDNPDAIFSLPDFRSEFFVSGDEQVVSKFKSIHSL